MPSPACSGKRGFFVGMNANGRAVRNLDTLHLKGRIRRPADVQWAGISKEVRGKSKE